MWTAEDSDLFVAFKDGYIPDHALRLQHIQQTMVFTLAMPMMAFVVYKQKKKKTRKNTLHGETRDDIQDA
jgi:hypothetical protein